MIMAEELPFFVEITDKWSKRRTAFRIPSQDTFRTVGQLVEYLGGLDDAEVKRLIDNEQIGIQGAAGLEDIQTALYHIKEDGELGGLIDEVRILQRGRMLNPNDQLRFTHQAVAREGYTDIYIADLKLDCDKVPWTRNWEGFYKRHWKRNPQFQEFVEGIVRAQHGNDADAVLAAQTPENQLKLIQALAPVFHEAPYELYSRFIGRRLKFKTGPETVQAIMDGRGGNCSEKASALEFVLMNYGINCHLVLGGDKASGTFPYSSLRSALDDFNFDFKVDAQQYWSHYANGMEIGGEQVLVDITGGPMPLLIATGDEATAYFNQQKSLPVKFLSRDENYFYHRAPEDIAYDMLFTMERFSDEIDLQHVGVDDIDNGFGFLIQKDFWVAPSLYQTEAEFSGYKRDWLAWGENPDSRMAKIEVYSNLDPSSEKTLLADLERTHPIVAADLRTAGEAFIDRCRKVWKDNSWQTGFVFARYK
jgi:hypothetical protein